MNFYKHHIGDYAQATAHLSFVEDAAYSRLIRKVYADEKPLPADVKAVQRLVGARAKEEREAVVAMLDEFFDLRDDGWHNKRCDAELEKANAQADTNRRIAEERELRRKERLAAEALRLANEASHESLNGPVNESLKSGENDSLSFREPSQTPDTRHQTPDLRQGPDTHTSAAPRVSMAGAICVTLKAEGIGSCNPGHPDLAVLIEQGAEVQNFVSAARAAVAKGKGFAYVLGIVKGQMAEARQLAADGRATPRPDRAAPVRQSATERRVETIAGLTGSTTERTDHAASTPGVVDVESRVVGEP